jgi:hypothetical protein
MTLLGQVEAQVAGGHLSASGFGRAVAGDPRLLFDWRRGRCLSPRLRRRIARYLARSPDALPRP